MTEIIEWRGSEDEQIAARMRACERRRRQYPDSDDQCDHDGSCDECEYDMAVALRVKSKREVMARRVEPAYVEDGSFRVVSDRHFGCLGKKLRHRVYVLRENPDQRPGNDISHTVAASWALAGQPVDAVFHLGSFHRVTVEP